MDQNSKKEIGFLFSVRFGIGLVLFVTAFWVIGKWAKYDCFESFLCFLERPSKRRSGMRFKRWNGGDLLWVFVDSVVQVKMA